MGQCPFWSKLGHFEEIQNLFSQLQGSMTGLIPEVDLNIFRLWRRKKYILSNSITLFQYQHFIHSTFQGNVTLYSDGLTSAHLCQQTLPQFEIFNFYSSQSWELLESGDNIYYNPAAAWQHFSCSINPLLIHLNAEPIYA